MLLRTRLLGLLHYLSGVWAWDEEHALDGPSIQSRVDPKVDSIVYYFAYGSNMFKLLFRLKCPDARLYGAALLQYHRLDFTMEVPGWNGAVATICRDQDSEVWGILWMIKTGDMDKLDEQEGVSAGWYHSKEVIVVCKRKYTIKAVTYVQNHSPRKLSPFDDYPPDRQPSITYLGVMIIGAVQGGIPHDYIQYLYTIRHNGKKASRELINKFNNKFKYTEPLL